MHACMCVSVCVCVCAFLWNDKSKSMLSLIIKDTRVLIVPGTDRGIEKRGNRLCSPAQSSFVHVHFIILGATCIPTSTLTSTPILIIHILPCLEHPSLHHSGTGLLTLQPLPQDKKSVSLRLLSLPRIWCTNCIPCSRNRRTSRMNTRSR